MAGNVQIAEVGLVLGLYSRILGAGAIEPGLSMSGLWRQEELYHFFDTYILSSILLLETILLFVCSF